MKAHSPLLLLVTASVTALVSSRAFAADPKPAATSMVPMRDGVHLATDIYLPAPDATDLPCLLVRTPYGRARYNREFGAAAAWGYAVAIQDMRGRFDSEGKAMAFRDSGWGERQDGYDTVEWLAAQPFSNGRVGTLGASAMGITQLLMAGAAPPSLVCQYILVGAPSLYHHSSYIGGAFRKKQVEDWLRGHAHPDALERTLAHPFYDETWVEVDAIARAPQVRVPALHYGGWYDTFCQGTIDGFVAWQTHGGEGARGRQKLVLGPWTHGGPSKTRFGDFELPRAARSVPFDISARAWFDHHLKRAANGVETLPTVMYYVMGPFDGSPSSGNVWRSAPAWPVPSTPVSWFLAAEGGLDREPPSGAAREVSWVYDPAKPVPTIGGRNLYLDAGPMDQRPIEKRDDVLVFTSAPLERDLEVTGRVTAHASVRTDRRDTDVVFRLCDVSPDGRSVLIADGIRRLMAANGGTPLEPGAALDVEVDLWSTSIVFAKGHRLRVSVTSSNEPKFAANPNTGSARYDPAEKPLVARNAITLGGERAARIVLPVVERDDDARGAER